MEAAALKIAPKQDIALVVRQTLADILPMQLKEIQPESVLAIEPLWCDQIDVMEWVCEVSDKLGIGVFAEEEELLNKPGATVQTAIDLFTKLYKQSNP
jgi:acyl carrier protein